VHADLEGQGYEVQAFIIPAASVNAPHKRERIWFVAYANDKGTSTGFRQVQSKNGEISQWDNDAKLSNTNGKFITNTENCNANRWKINNSHRQQINKTEWQRIWGEFGNVSKQGVASNSKTITNPKSIRQEQTLENRELERGRFRKSDERNLWDTFPLKSPLCGGDDGLPRELDGITFPKWRNESIKAYGNAIVPQVAYELFKAIDEFEDILKIS
jgi:DNA (cytosine-5)-methyltransferase 1